MTRNGLLVLEREIEEELKSLERLDTEMAQILGRPDISFIETRAAGSILHDFYSGIERIFRRIASRIDRDTPSGEDWHTDLLTRMSISLEGTRPNVISESLRDKLSEYLRFRHLFRNIYGFGLKWERCRTLGMMLNETLSAFDAEMKKFLRFIDSLRENL